MKYFFSQKQGNLFLWKKRWLWSKHESIFYFPIHWLLLSHLWNQNGKRNENHLRKLTAPKGQWFLIIHIDLWRDPKIRMARELARVCWGGPLITRAITHCRPKTKTVSFAPTSPSLFPFLAILYLGSLIC